MRARTLVVLCLQGLLGLQLGAQVINPPSGQSDTTEWQGWCGLSLEWQPVKSVKLALNEQWRWDNDFGDFDRQIHQLDVAWSPRWNAFSKAQSLGAALRHTTRPDNKGDIQGKDRFLRWQVEYTAQVEPGRWSMEGRLRYQRQSALALKDESDPADYSSRVQTRIKGAVVYNIKGWKWDPEFSVERFLVQVPEGWPSDGSWRFRLGSSKRMGKRQKLRIFLQRDAQGRYTPTGWGGLDDFRLKGSTEWTVGVTWRYRIKSKRKKKEA